MSDELLHVFRLRVSNHDEHCLKSKPSGCSSKLCQSTSRVQLKEQHDSSAARLIEGPAAEVELNLGSGIKLDRRLIICLGNSREGKNGIRDFAWQFWHMGGGIRKKHHMLGLMHQGVEY